MTEQGKTIAVRKAVPADAEAVSGIERRTSASPWSLNSLSDDISSRDRAYVAVAVQTSEDDVTIIGYADMWLIAGEAQLNNIAVDAEYRGQGLGRKLLTHMAEKAADRGCRIMTLEVRAGNEAAIGLYKSAGFTQTGMRKAYYADNGEDALLMDLDLTESNI